ncbi:hypothetical protein ACFP3I_06190 [Chryseobacterium arachidis]
MTTTLAQIAALFKLIFLISARQRSYRAEIKKIASAESWIKLLIISNK